jgi:hypothetical protein
MKIKKRLIRIVKAIDRFKQAPSLLVSRKGKSSGSKKKHMQFMGSLYGGVLTIFTVGLCIGVLSYLMGQMYSTKNDNI